MTEQIGIDANGQPNEAFVQAVQNVLNQIDGMALSEALSVITTSLSHIVLQSPPELQKVMFTSVLTAVDVMAQNVIDSRVPPDAEVH